MKKVSKVLAILTLTCVWGAALLSVSCANNSNSSNNGGSEGVVTYIGIKAPSVAKAVGDILFSDGSATSYSESLVLTDAQKGAAIAVIFYVGTECSNNGANRTLGVGLAQNTSGHPEWCIRSANAYSKEITTIYDSDKDGSDNLEQIGTFLVNNSSTNDTAIQANYPAFYFAKNYASQNGSHVSGTSYANGWYLPARAELQKIFVNKTTINAALSKVGGTQFANAYYWSASQYDSSINSDGNCYAHELNFESGMWFYDYKYGPNNRGYVCCIRAF